jgi:hypothetical protein
MQTLLSRFCEEFVRILHPLLPPLQSAAETVAAGTGGNLCRTLQAPLVEIRDQMDLLAEKVSGQQAYVLIFGPLKSGKSTLMNAIAGSYVSEVSSLPAYPCMVFVSHGNAREFALTRYDGSVEKAATPSELQTKVDEAHKDLATRIREVEATGAEFDPRVHFSEAISRIDVRVPTNELGQSRAVLVDTPGLYSRMKFGYDRMTREFRDAAACAIFVVRSDNLFLDQVFAEFNRLLELFSRIFLIVNVDSSKQDLGPDGTLVPSLEQRDPERIIDAFQSLAMSAPLRDAKDEGRLRIYPVDLLRSARGRLGAHRNGKSEEGNGRADGADFHAFLRDFTDYLNSSDYLVSFLGDSLRRATALLDDAKSVCTRNEVRELRKRVEAAATRLSVLETRSQAIERLEGAAWTKRFDALCKDLATSCASIADDLAEKTSRAIDQATGQWFKSHDSLQTLSKHDLVQIFTGYQEELTNAVSRELGARLLRTGMGIDLSDQLAEALTTADIDLPSICRDAHQNVDLSTLIALPPTPLRSDFFPVRRTIWDWLLFRGAAALQRRLFGPADNPALSITPEAKESRLGQAGRGEMRRRLDIYRRGFLKDNTERIIDGFARSFCRQVQDELMRTLRRRRAQVEADTMEAEEQQRSYEKLLSPLEELQQHAASAHEAISHLADHYGKVDLYLLTQPVLPGYKLPALPPQRVSASEPPVPEPRALQ